MNIEVEEIGKDTAVVRLAGRLDMLSAAEVKGRMVELVGAGRKMQVVDLAAVPFVDSSGLGALIGALKATRIAGGDLRIARVGDQARVVLELTTLDRVMKPYATVEEALAGK